MPCNACISFIYMHVSRIAPSLVPTACAVRETREITQIGEEQVSALLRARMGWVLTHPDMDSFPRRSDALISVTISAVCTLSMSLHCGIVQ